MGRVELFELAEQSVEFGQAFPALFARAYRVAFRLLGSRPDAEDLAQDALARAFVRWPTIAARQPEAWVAVVTANLAIDIGRQRTRRRSFRPDRLKPVETEGDALERMALREALRSLAGRQQQVVVLRYVADLSEADVATALHITVGSVKQHAARGCAQLRARLGDLHQEDDDVRPS